MKKTISTQISFIILIVLAFTACKKEKPADCNCHGSDSTAVKVTVFATGFNNPRGLKFGPDGMLYVAEAGIGGKDSTVGKCLQVAFPIGPFVGSPIGGRISKVSASGLRTTVSDRLPSSKGNDITGGDIEGVADIAFLNGIGYALIAGGGCTHGVPSVPNSIVRMNGNGGFTVIANLSEWLLTHPAKNTAPGDFDPEGTPYSMIVYNNNFYVIEPNHGEFLKVTPAGVITRIADISATQGHIVPTVVAAYNGNFLVSNLAPFPIVEGSSNVYKITPAGQISIWATGVTSVLGIAVDDKYRVYILENTVGAPFPTPGMGRIIRINENGSRSIIYSGLTLPTGLTIGPDKNLYVSNVGLGPTAIGGGQVLKIEVKDCAKKEVGIKY
ncbi:MAG: ScyD/ScyE family protein [Chitinophagaceae bacterium]